MSVQTKQHNYCEPSMQEPKDDPSVFASILLSLGSQKSYAPPASSGNEGKLPGISNLLAGNCPNCFYPSASVRICHRCLPERWNSCSAVLISKYPDLNPVFAFASPFFVHASKFIQDHNMPLVKIFCPLNKSQVFALPIEFQATYLASFDAEFVTSDWPYMDMKRKLRLIESQKNLDSLRQNFRTQPNNLPEPAFPVINEAKRRRSESAVNHKHIPTVVPMVTEVLVNHEKKRLKSVDEAEESISGHSDPPISPPPTVYRVSSVESNLTTRSAKDSQYKQPSPKTKDDQDDPTPRAQPVKSANDLYTPKWVRYSGAKKEGLCDLCIPEKWLQLKDSAFWYHKQFLHGISSVCGSHFLSPTEYRTVWNGVDMGNNSGVSVHLMTEGKCHHCNNWEPLFKNKKRFSHYFGTLEAAKDCLMRESSSVVIKPSIINESPLKISVGRASNNVVYAPAGLCISSSLLEDVRVHESGHMSSLWWRHAHKCHDYSANKLS